MTAALAARAPAQAVVDAQSGFEQWQRMLVDWVRSGRPDLTNRQLSILSIVVDDPDPQTVRGLAGCLSLAKPVVSRALDRLEELQFLRRMPDRRDRRNVLIVPTGLGKAFIKELAADFKKYKRR